MNLTLVLLIGLVLAITLLLKPRWKHSGNKEPGFQDEPAEERNDETLLYSQRLLGMILILAALGLPLRMRKEFSSI